MEQIEQMVDLDELVLTAIAHERFLLIGVFSIR